MYHFNRDLQRRQIQNYNRAVLRGKIYERGQIPVKTFANLFLGTLKVQQITKEFVTRIFFFRDPTPVQKAIFGIRSDADFSAMQDALLIDFESERGVIETCEYGPDRRLLRRVEELDKAAGNEKKLRAFLKKHAPDPELLDELIYGPRYAEER